MFRLINEYRRRWEEFAPQLRRLYLFSALQQLGLGASGLVLVLRLSRLGWSELQIAQLAAVGLAAGTLVALPAGLTVGRIGARRAVIAASLALSLTAALKAVATAPAALTALAAVDGACLAVLYTTYGPLLFEITHPKERSIAYSLDFFLVSLCTPGGAMLAGLFLQAGTVPAVRLLPHMLGTIMAGAALLMALSIVPLLSIAEPDTTVTNEPTEVPAAQPRTLRLWLLIGLQLLSAFLFSAAIAHLQPVSVIFLGDRLHLSAGGIARVNGLLAVGSSLLVLSSPLLVRRVGLGGTLVLIKGTAMIAIFSLATLIRPAGALPAYLIWAASVQCTGPLRERLALEAWPGRRRGIASGSLYALQNGGGTVGSLVGGVLTAKGGFALSLTIAGALVALSLISLLILPAQRKLLRALVEAH